MSKLLRHLGLLVAGFTAVVVVACTATGEPAGPTEGAPTASPTQATTASPTQTPVTLPTQTPAASPTQTPTAIQLPTTAYDSTENMFRFYSGLDHEFDDTREAITLAIANNDKSMVPVMIEMLRFWGIGELGLKAHEAIAVITGHELGISSRAWHMWMEWLGKNADDYRPPNRYVEWKIQLMSRLDPRFGEFLAPAAQGSRINVVEIAWGGVVPDGIPDLQNAPVVSADDQDYLLPSDRVFGVSINGEHRAYPLRIVNAHEMANDVLGGEPIALAY